MRIGSCEVSWYLSIREPIRFYFGPLTILFGANSTGKTSILEALQCVLTGVDSNRLDPMTAEFPCGGVYVELEEADVPGSADSDLLARALREFLKWLRARTRAQAEELAAALAQLDEGEVRRAFIESIAWYYEGAADNDELLAFGQQLLNRVGFWYEGPDRASLVFSPDLDAKLEAELLPKLAEFDRAWEIDLAASLLRNGEFKYYSPGMSEAAAPARPSVLLAEFDPEHLAQETMEAIEQLHKKMLDPPYEIEIKPAVGAYRPKGGSPGDQETENEEPGAGPLWLTPDVWKMARDAIVVETGPLGAFPVQIFPDIRLYEDPWLIRVEPLTEAVTDWPASSGELDSSQHQFRLRPTMQLVADNLARRANELAPSFVQEQGRIVIEVVEPAFWRAIPSRIRIALAEGETTSTEISRLGAGVARWIAVAIRLASSQLQTAERRIVDVNGAFVTDLSEMITIVRSARSNPETLKQILLDPVDQPTVILIDEPELHLHPRAVRSVARWLEARASEGLNVLAVATHHPLLLKTALQTARRYELTRSPEGTVITAMDDDIEMSLRRISEEFGLTEADILLFSDLVLFVEGEQDRAVLQEMFGTELAQAGVTLVPLNGINGIPLLADAEVVWRLGIPAGVLVDHAWGRTKEARLTGELETRARRLKRPLKVLRLREVGIEFYIDADVIREHLGGVHRGARAPIFPGWEEANSEYRAKMAASGEAFSGEGWKRWLAERYGLQITAESLRNLARECASRQAINKELQSVVKEITAFAVDRLPPDL